MSDFVSRVNLRGTGHALEFATDTKDLGFSKAVYGFGAGIVYLGYMLFEVPSNLFLKDALGRSGSERSQEPRKIRGACQE